MLKPSQLAELAASFAAGSISAEHIEAEHGHDVLGAVLGLAAGLGAGALVVGAMRVTGVSDLIDDLFDW